MSYFLTKNPAFPAGLDIYVGASNPAFPAMSDFVSPNAGKTCPCVHKRKKRRLGQLAPDGSDDNFGVPTGIANLSTPTAPYPASPESGMIYAPTESEDSASSLNISYPGSGFQTVLPPVGAVSPLSAGGAVYTPSGNQANAGTLIAASGYTTTPTGYTLTPSGQIETATGLTSSDLLFGGVILGVILLISTSKRR